MATYYVATTGNDATGDGSSGAPYATPGKAATVATSDGDIIYVKSGTYTCTTDTPGAAGPVTLTANAAIRMEGYYSTAGDKCVGGTLPVLSAGTISPGGAMFMILMDGADGKEQVLAYFKVDGNSRSNVSGIDGTGGRETCIGCEVTGCTGFGFQSVKAIKCKSYSNGGVGFSYGQFVYCESYDNGGIGFSSGHAVSCIAHKNDGAGFDGYALLLVNCVAYSNGGDGFDSLRNDVMVNCISSNNTGFSYDTTAGSVLVNCASYTTGSRTDATPAEDLGPINLVGGHPFVDPDAVTPDFNLNTTAQRGAYCRAAGLDVYGQDGAIDVGAVQHADPASSGSSPRFGDMTGGLK